MKDFSLENELNFFFKSNFSWTNYHLVNFGKKKEFDIIPNICNKNNLFECKPRIRIALKKERISFINGMKRTHLEFCAVDFFEHINYISVTMSSQIRNSNKIVVKLLKRYGCICTQLAYMNTSITHTVTHCNGQRRKKAYIFTCSCQMIVLDLRFILLHWSEPKRRKIEYSSYSVWWATERNQSKNQIYNLRKKGTFYLYY